MENVLKLSKEELDEAFTYGGTVEKDGHYKDSTFYASRELNVNDDIVETFPSLKCLQGCVITQTGTWSDDWGFEEHSDFEIFEASGVIHHPEEVIVKEAYDETVYKKLPESKYVWVD